MRFKKGDIIKYKYSTQTYKIIEVFYGYDKKIN